MITEIVESGYHLDHEVWSNPCRGVQRNSGTGVNFFDPYKGWSSGPSALWLASTHNYNEIFILGFDYKGLDGKLNNIYADTKNYKRSTDNATYYGNWLNQTVKVIKEFRHIKYYRVIEEGNFIPDKLVQLPNITHITYSEFHLIRSK